MCKKHWKKRQKCLLCLPNVLYDDLVEGEFGRFLFRRQTAAALRVRPILPRQEIGEPQGGGFLIAHDRDNVHLRLS